MSLRRNRARRALVAVLATLAALAAWVVVGGGTAAAEGGPSVAPVFVAGNPSCTGLGYDYGYKPQPEPPPTGTYTFPGDDETVAIVSDGTYFSWTSTLGIDAVIVKGGPNANAYVYDPPAESLGDSNLRAPTNPNNGQPYGISHIEFCYDYEVDVAKTAATTFTRTWEWTIKKSVTPDTINQFTGDSTDAEYTVEVEKTGYTDSDWAVSGTITIENNTPFGATVTGVTDAISGFGAVSVTCPVTLPAALAAGESLECTYSTALTDGSNRTNTATVTTSGSVGGGTATAAVTFVDPTTVVNGTINVDDTNGDSWQFSASGKKTYKKTFTCDTDEGENGNTATIRETKQSASASVTVNCYALSVTKDASTSFTRTWNWTIEKKADQSSLTLADGQLFAVNYSVKVSASSKDSDWAVTGKIAVHNPAPIDATLNGVSDVVSPAVNATVDCGVTFPYTLAAGGTLDCTYSASLPDASDRTNTATATLQNSPSGTTDFTGTAAVSFASATMTEVDECIDVSDTNFGSPLGTVCAGVDTLPKTFTYTLTFGSDDDLQTPPNPDVLLECGENTHTNTASFTTNDEKVIGSSSWTVDATVECQGTGGCTLTQGYWKTHSKQGPAPYDSAWANLGPLEEATPFFGSGKTWYTVFWTAPAGNAYYVLAHQYMAAKLNILNGASTTAAVDAAILGAEALFNAQGVNDTTLTRAERTLALGYASTLDQYNNGLIGPGHCSEQ